MHITSDYIAYIPTPLFRGIRMFGSPNHPRSIDSMTTRFCPSGHPDRLSLGRGIDAWFFWKWKVAFSPGFGQQWRDLSQPTWPSAVLTVKAGDPGPAHLYLRWRGFPAGGWGATSPWHPSRTSALGSLSVTSASVRWWGVETIPSTPQKQHVCIADPLILHSAVVAFEAVLVPTAGAPLRNTVLFFAVLCRRCPRCRHDT